MLANFTITLEYEGRPKRAVEVVIHNNVQALRAAIRQHDRSWGKPGNAKGVLGVCHRFEAWPEGTPEKIETVCALVRLAPPNIGIGLVSHELAHAAVWIRTLNEGNECALTCENDEEFCWILGELVRQTVAKLYEHNLY
jgi:hypothetical protein